MRPICIHAWLARDNTPHGNTCLHRTLPKRNVGTCVDGEFHWESYLPMILSGHEGAGNRGHHGLRRGQIKAVVITEDES